MLTCCCGGNLQIDHVSAQRSLAEATLRIAGPCPRHRKKRIQKKLLKRWHDRARFAFLVLPISRQNYACEKCRKREGFYSAIGRNLFLVEPMPPAPSVFYMSWATYDREEEK